MQLLITVFINIVKNRDFNFSQINFKKSFFNKLQAKLTFQMRKGREFICSVTFFSWTEGNNSGSQGKLIGN